jgi:hypothetical protein
MKRPSVSTLVLACCIAAAATCSAAPREIDLNAPGALETLRQQDPAAYTKVQAILAGVLKHQDQEVPHWIQTAYDGRDVAYRPFLLVTFPAKRRLGFTLGDTRYDATIVLDATQFRAVPADWQPPSP